MKKLIFILVLTLGMFSMQAQEQDCVAYATSASQDEYYTITPYLVQIADENLGLFWVKMRIGTFYQDWYDFCEGAGGTAGPPAFVGF